MKINQKGFGAVEGLLILILISILGFTGYYVYHTRNNATLTYNNAVNTSATNPDALSSKFVFKDLGVQFDPKSDLKGLVYRVDSGYYYLSDDAFVSVLKSCPDYHTGDDFGGFAAIGKTSGQYPADANPIQAGALLKQFPKFWISYGFPNGLGCSDTSKARSIHDAAATEAGKFYSDFQKTATLVQ
jgi:hypothetical protein